MPYHTPKKEKPSEKEDAPKQSSKANTKSFEDNRSTAIAQRKLQNLANNSPQLSQLKAQQEKANANQSTSLIPSAPTAEKETIQAKCIASNANNTVVQLVGDKDEDDGKSKKKDTSIGTQVLKQGATTGFAEKTGTAITAATGGPSLDHPTSLIKGFNEGATGAVIVSDVTGIATGLSKVNEARKANHLSTSERAKEATTSIVSTTATAAKTGLDAAHAITRASSFAPPAALLGAVVGGVELVKGGVDASAATKLKKTLKATTAPTKSSLGSGLSTLEVSAAEKQREAIVGASIGGGKLVTGALLAALGFAHAGPIGIAVSAAILGALGVASLAKFAAQRHQQKKMGMDLVDRQYHLLAQERKSWQAKINNIEDMLENARENLTASRTAFEGIDKRIKLIGQYAAPADLALLEAKRMEFANRVTAAENTFDAIYRARYALYEAEPKIDPRYDRARIKGHWRGFGDVFREELNEKALRAAEILHSLIQKAWKYQIAYLKIEISDVNRKLGQAGLSLPRKGILERKQIELRTQLLSGKGEFTGPIVGPAMNQEVLAILKQMGIKYDRSKNKPSVGDLHKVISKNLASFKG